MHRITHAIRSVFVLLLLSLSMVVAAQVPYEVTDHYFQQQVDYDIAVTLDDEAHTLTGYVDMVYTNNSPNVLRGVYIHLWPNAYRDKNTAFAKQQRRLGKRQFLGARSSERGGYTQIDFEVDEVSVPYAEYEGHADIVVIDLPEPLQPGEQTTISASFTLDIPSSFSRLGHVDQSYQMTQWYPKPAVYDAEGWHPMPYLDQGEFYSEYGDYKVALTLPANYVVGATGVLETESERDFLEGRMRDTERILQQNLDTIWRYPNKPLRRMKADYLVDTFPASSADRKTIVYTAEQVHDFAWFADKRFLVSKDEVTLPSGKVVDTWAMYPPTDVGVLLSWGGATKYIGRAVQYYSERVGEYPYPQATAVMSALSAGAGMEYPMVTVIGDHSFMALDEVITHEVGHNWFYGILGFNERDYPWLDEGLNTFYERAYMSRYYPGDSTYVTYSGPAVWLGVEDDEELTYLSRYSYDRLGQLQPVQLHSDSLTDANYYLSAYDRPAALMAYVEAWLGQETFDRVMQSFYTKWKFRHPQPKDVQQHFAEETGKPMAWLFEDVIQQDKRLDYALADLVATAEGDLIEVHNKGNLNAPFSITGYKDGVAVHTAWYSDHITDGGAVVEVVRVAFPLERYDKLVLDAQRLMPEWDRSDNYLFISKNARVSRSRPVRLRFLGGIDDPGYRDVYYAPAIAYNYYDGLQLGLTFHNGLMPPKTWEASLTPMYGFRSEQATGVAYLGRHQYYDRGPFSRWSTRAQFRRFSFNGDRDENYTEQYNRLKLNVELELDNDTPSDGIRQLVGTDNYFIHLRYAEGTPSIGNFFKDDLSYYIGEVYYSYQDYSPLRPMQWTTTVEGSRNYIKLFTEYEQEYKYARKGSFRMRAFAGAFLYRQDGLVAETPNGFFRLNGAVSEDNSPVRQNDYRFEELLLGRTEGLSDSEAFKPILSQQIFASDGGFKSINSNLRLGTGGWLVALNLSSDEPTDLPVRIYADIAAMPSISIDAPVKLYFSAGASLVLIPEVFEIYFPFYETENIIGNGIPYDTIVEQSYFRRISFKLDMTRLDPFRFIREFRR